MRRVSIPAAVATAMFMTASQLTAPARSANAGSSDMPGIVPTAPLHLRFEGPALPPMAYTMFCLRYREECRARPLFRGGPVHLSGTRWADLKDVNQTVNKAIIPQSREPDAAVEPWLIDPERGDCSDYAVSKRHKLLSLGWPQRALLLAEVVTVWGKHHLILLVRTKSSDLVLDNLTQEIRPWSRAPYRWIRIQSPGTPRYWSAIAPRGV